MTSEETSPKGRPILSDEFINELIHIQKHIPKDVKEPFKTKIDGLHMKSKVELYCNNYKFALFTRAIIKDPKDFSVVFAYIDSKGRKYIIRRYNGDHGKHYHKNTNTYISGTHIHTITERSQKEYHKDETEAVETNMYQTLDEAIKYALRDLNIDYEYRNGVR